MQRRHPEADADARTPIACADCLKEAGLPILSVLTHPRAASTASYAMMGDVQIAELCADLLCRDLGSLKQTMRKKLPEGFPDVPNICMITGC